MAEVKSSQDKFDANLTDAYKMCDAEFPIIGGICDIATTSTGIKAIIVWIIAIPLIGFVLFCDIFGDIFTGVFDFLGDALDGVPVVGSIIGIVVGGGLDDFIDAASMIIMFVFCGPITLVGIPEFANGFLEIFPFWTSLFIVWLIFIRPARLRYLSKVREQEQTAVAAVEALEGPKPGKNLLQQALGFLSFGLLK